MGIINLLRNRKEKQQLEIKVIDDNKELADFRKIPIPDLKQYLVKGYEEIREVKRKNEELEKELENVKNYKHLYDSALVTTSEYEKRCEETRLSLEAYKSKLEERNKLIYEQQEKLNNYKIKENELDQENEKLKKQIKDIKDKLK